MARKFAIELEDSVFEELKKSYMEAKKMNMNAEFTFEEFLSELLKSYADTKKQMDAMGDSFKNMMNSFGGAGGLEEMLNNMMKGAQASSSETNKDTAKEKETSAEDKTEKHYKS
ncbi:hypothetical protein [Ureaplasma ceti]|uniref:Uncharacterized protein n=1 Tax=Ureaplasma ceti TaxID=3119530 RepID=A0ABP9U8V9_9BACT